MNVRMARQDLFHQRRAGAWHTDDEYGQFRIAAQPFDTAKEFRAALPHHLLGEAEMLSPVEALAPGLENLPFRVVGLAVIVKRLVVGLLPVENMGESEAEDAALIGRKARIGESIAKMGDI